MRREQIIERLQRGGYIASGIYSSDPYHLCGGTAWPKDSREDTLAINSCHKGDVDRMIKKGEIVMVPSHRIAYPNYVLPEHKKAATA